LYVCNTSDDDTGTFDRAAHFQAANVIKFRLQYIGFAEIAGGEVAHFQRQEKQRHHADGNKEADPEVEYRPIHQRLRNMKEVRTKSRARMASAEVTTVRVMARDTPSAVGTES